jgi:choline dehydrogenase-like flavoprotein
VSERARADAVVIGSGAGGGPAAAALAESGLDVLVLEAGPRLEARDFSDDEGEMRMRLGRAVTTDDAGQSLYAGSCVGGSTVINDCLCWRTPQEVLEHWRRQHDLTALSDDAFAPFVEQVWRDVQAEPTGRSHINRNAHRLEVGARRLGWDAGPMWRNVRGCARLGRCNFGCPIDAKQSSLVSWLPRAERAGARVWANARADRIRIREGRVAGVEVTILDPTTRAPIASHQVEAPRVCVAAGVLESGALLQRSGIAPRTAGQGIQFHSSAYVTGRFEEPVHGYYGPTMAYAITEFSDVNGHDGPGYMLENTAVQPIQTASVLPDAGVPHERAMAALPFLAHTVIVLRDRTRGHIDLDGDGGARVHYALEEGDLERLRDGIANAARAYLAADAREVYLPLHGFGPVRREDDLAALADFPLDRSRFSLLYAVHLFGGAAMGGSADTSVCAVDGSCWDARGLYVVDAAALPGNTGVNPQITIMANALRIAGEVAAGGAAG